MKKVLWILALVAGIILGVVGFSSGDGSLQNLPDYLNGFKDKATESDNVPWVLLHLWWMSAIIAVYSILFWTYRHRRKKVPVGTQKKSDEEIPPLFEKWTPIVWLLILSGSIIFVLFPLFYFGITWALLTLVVFTAPVFYLFPSVISDIKVSVQALRDVKKKHLVEKEVTTFKDVGGVPEVIAELNDILSLYKDDDDWGIRMPKGILLTGPAGCGKTLIARAIAGEAGVPFLEYSAAEIGDKYVRSGSQETKSIFEDARRLGRCVIFLDEIDALGRRRGMDTSGEFDHALNQLLHEMDGFRKDKEVIVIAATNREDVLDEALLRPGRFDKKIFIPPPDMNGRKQILEIHTAKKRFSGVIFADDVALEKIAELTSGFSGAGVEQLTNEAVQVARRRYKEARKDQGIVTSLTVSLKEALIGSNGKIVTKADFEEAILRVTAGIERNLVIGQKERLEIARHEIGHAIVAIETDQDVLKKITLSQRSWSLGLTLVSPKEERHSHQKTALLARITMLLGGRAAEEILSGEQYISTGGANDFERAEELARKMVCEWGMGKKGIAVFCRLDAVGTRFRPLSEYTLAEIDREVGEIKLSCYEEAKKIITGKRKLVERLVELLLEKTVLDDQEVIAVVQHEENRSDIIELGHS